MSRNLVGMDTRKPVSPSPTHLVDASLRHAKDVIAEVFEAAAKLDKDRSPRSRTAILRLANLRELAFDVAVARDELQRGGGAPDAHTALREEALHGLDEAKTVLSRLIEAEEAFAARVSATRQGRTARRA